MINKNKRNHWTKERCIETANQCKLMNEFRTKYNGAYKACVNNNWVDEVCCNLIRLRKPNNYWTKDRCHIEAKKYKSRSEFNKSSKGAYKASLKNNWLDEISNHMEEKGSIYKRYNYIFEFDDNHVYIGLTCDINRRMNEHKNSEDSPVYKHIKKSNLKPKIIIDNLKPVNESKLLEINTIKLYNKNGWVLLNKDKGGSVGSTKKSKWTKEKCYEEAKKYKSRSEFQKGSHTAYKVCLKNKTLNEVCSHMKRKKVIKPIYNKWTKKECHSIALKYKTKKEFYINNQNPYRYSIRNGFLDEICSHMKKTIKIKS